MSAKVMPFKATVTHVSGIDRQKIHARHLAQGFDEMGFATACFTCDKERSFIDDGRCGWHDLLIFWLFLLYGNDVVML